MDFYSLTPELMYRASLKKDSAFDGIFYMAVKTTGIFCRSSCTARKPKFENVSFYPTAADAIQAGFRACKVCKPSQLVEAPPDEIKKLLCLLHAQPNTRLKDEDLVKIGLVPATVRRWFNRHYGMTFQAYQRTQRIQEAFGQLKRGAKVSEAAYDNGFESLSGFHSSFKKTTGQNPAKARKSNDSI